MDTLCQDYPDTQVGYFQKPHIRVRELGSAWHTLCA
jgi:hypothetical protein